MKVALCFIINYDHVLTKEHLWRQWIEPNKDIINVYFYYKHIQKIKSKWIIDHALPQKYIYNTSYYHVIPAYISLLNFSYAHDTDNKWFCMLTDSCCPIITPTQFRHMFYKNSNSSIFSWKPAWWNPSFHKRGNLEKLPKHLWLANDAWFVLSREKVNEVKHFVLTNQSLTKTICEGGLANESLFAIIFCLYKSLNKNIINYSSHAIDWSRQSTTTSPHVFIEGNDTDIQFINKELERNKYTIFIRKIAPEFPDDILLQYITDTSSDVTTIKKYFNKYVNNIIMCILFIAFSIYFRNLSTSQKSY
jgi:hypothetical protein